MASDSQFSASAGPITIVNLTASVPAGAPSGSKAILDLSNQNVSAVDTNDLPSIADDGVQIAAFRGDTNNSQAITTGDITALLRSISGALGANGFPALKLADPALVGDMNDTGSLTTGDATGLLRFLSGAVGGFPQIPALPPGLTPPATGADPQIFIPTDLIVSAGGSVVVPVRVRVTEPAGASIAGLDVTLRYDASRFTIKDVNLGAALAGFNFAISVNSETPGVLRVLAASGFGPAFAHNFVGTLLNVTLMSRASATTGSSPLNLSAAAASDNNGVDLTIAPAVTPGSDASDGMVRIFSATPPISRTLAVIAPPLFTPVQPVAVAVPIPPATTKPAAIVPGRLVSLMSASVRLLPLPKAIDAALDWRPL